MKRLIFFLCVWSFFTAWAYSQTPGGSAGKGALTMAIDGFKSDRGIACIALCNSEESYKIEEKAFLSRKVPIVQGKVLLTFQEIPFGTYAVKVFHDENGNGRLDKSIVGAPVELYGFSNNARSVIGRPAYKKAAFALNKPEMTVNITVQ